MLPGNLNAATVILLAIAPGFIATTVWARARTWQGSSGDLRTVIESLALSLVIQIALAPLTLTWLYPHRRDLEDFPERVSVWLLLAVLVLPVVGGLVIGKLSNWLAGDSGPRGGFRLAVARIWPSPTPPTVWDWLFTKNPPDGCFLLVEYESGEKVAGTFAEGSMALTSPEPQGLYLAEEWIVDDNGDITSPVPGSQGILIHSLDGVRTIRVLRGADDEREEA